MDRHNALFSVPFHDELWSKVLDKLERKHGLFPSYFFVEPRSEDRTKRISKRYPGAIQHPWYNAYRGIPAEGLPEGFAVRELDAPLLSRLRPYELNFLKIVDRLGPSFSFTFAERQRLWHTMLSYWLGVLEALDMRLLYFPVSPHNGFDYVIHAAARHLKRPVVTGVRTHVAGTFMHMGGIGEMPFGLMEHYESDDVIEPGEQVTEHLESVRSKEHRLWTIESKDMPPGTFVSEWSALAEYMKLPGVPYEESWCTPEQWGQLQQMAIQHRGKLKRTYDNLAVEPVEGEDFIYLALHYQPERSTAPDAGCFVDQLLMARLLAAAAPKGWKVYVREHPMQFSDTKYGELGRDWLLYRDLAAIPNVRIISTRIENLYLLDSARVCATGTGSTGWEGAVRGRPSVIFGNAWYRGCEGVSYCQSLDDVKHAVRRAADGYVPDRARVDRFAQAVMDVGFRGYLEPGWPESVFSDLTFDKRVSNVENAVVGAWHKAMGE